MKKLTYKKIANSVIEVDLQNGYTIVAFINNDNDEIKYEVTLYIRDEEISMFDLMGDFEYLEFNTTQKTIHSAILKQIATLMEDGCFNRYFDRYEYMLKCFDKGNELFEQESLGDN